MADPKDELKQIAAQMAKKGTFITAANKLTSMIQSSYKSSDAALKEEFFATTKRGAHLLKSRYTAVGFWRAGRDVFQAQLEAAEGEAEKCKSAKECETAYDATRLELAAAEVGATEEKDSTQAPKPSSNPPTAPANPLPSRSGGVYQEGGFPGGGLGGEGDSGGGLDDVIRDIDLEQLLAMLGNGVQVLGEGGGDSGAPPPASREARFNLGVKTVDGGVVCAVCQEEFPPRGKAKVMPCGHPFHYDCLMEWLERHNSCPTCRYALPSEKPAFDLAADRVAARDPTSTPLYS